MLLDSATSDLLGSGITISISPAPMVRCESDGIELAVYRSLASIARGEPKGPATIRSHVR